MNYFNLWEYLGHHILSEKTVGSHISDCDCFRSETAGESRYFNQSQVRPDLQSCLHSPLQASSPLKNRQSPSKCKNKLFSKFEDFFPLLVWSHPLNEKVTVLQWFFYTLSML